jgi:glycerol-3-phosphate dehydrogenase
LTSGRGLPILSGLNRDEQLSRLADDSEPWDLVVIGGGATGLSIALDSATRGYRTALLEQADFAEGTSSKSTKLIHGGVRYLRNGEIGLVRESLRERGRLLRNAAGIVEPLAFVVPAYRWHERLFYGTGLSIYDRLAGDLGIGRTGHLDRKAVSSRIPNLRRRGLRGGTLYWDGQFDDAALALAMARTAVAHGAAVVNHVRVTGLVKENGRIRGVEAKTRFDGRELRLRSRVVVNATGVFTDEVRRLDDPGAGESVRPSQGIHLVLDRSFLGGDTAVMIPKTEDGRVLFLIPWKNRLLLGTTDTEGVETSLHPRPLAEEIDYLLRHAAGYLEKVPTHDDLRATFAGLRPLAGPPKTGKGDGSTASLSRSHCLFTSASGLVTMTGGKWTTCRQMGEDAVDRAVAVGGLEPRPCRTAELTLLGPGQVEATGADGFIDPALPYRWSEVDRAVREEMALTLDDVLSRRTRCAFLDETASLRCAPAVAARMAEWMGRDAAWARGEVAAFAALQGVPTSQSPSVVDPDGS